MKILKVYCVVGGGGDAATRNTKGEDECAGKVRTKEREGSNSNVSFSYSNLSVFLGVAFLISIQFN